MSHRLALVLLLAAALLSVWIYQAVRGPGPGLGKADGEAPEAYATAVQARRYDATGRLIQQLTARRMIRHGKAAHTELLAPEFFLYPLEGPRWKARAERAFLAEDGRRIDLRERVRIRRLPDHRTPPGLFLTRRLLIFPDRDEAETDARVTWQTPDLSVTAVGMRARLDTSEVDLLSQVHARLAPPRKKEDG